MLMAVTKPLPLVTKEALSALTALFTNPLVVTLTCPVEKAIAML
jgi:hypothetical protein